MSDQIGPEYPTGTHRRIRYQLLMEYKQKRDEESRSALDELVNIAQENDMGY